MDSAYIEQQQLDYSFEDELQADILDERPSPEDEVFLDELISQSKTPTEDAARSNLPSDCGSNGADFRSDGGESRMEIDVFNDDSYLPELDVPRPVSGETSTQPEVCELQQRSPGMRYDEADRYSGDSGFPRFSPHDVSPSNEPMQEDVVEVNLPTGGSIGIEPPAKIAAEVEKICARFRCISAGSEGNLSNPKENPLHHQLFHYCHSGERGDLMDILNYKLLKDWDFTKAVIICRSDERIRILQRSLWGRNLNSVKLLQTYKEEKMLEKLKAFQVEDGAHILLCSARILPPRQYLEQCDLIIYWNRPWMQEDFNLIWSRLSRRTLIVVFLTNKDDWIFLDEMASDGFIFPELDLSSREPFLLRVVE